MVNNASVSLFGQHILRATTVNLYTRPALASCRLLKWLGGYLCLVFIFGIALNGFVLYILLNKKSLRSPINIFLVALSSADLTHALLGIPLPLTSNLACRWLYGKYLCYFEGFLAYSVGMIGLYLLCALSLNRYWMIVTPAKTKYVDNRTVYISIFLAIVGALFWAIVPIFGWNDYTLEGVLTSCSIRWQDGTLNVITYTTSMFIFAYIIPLILMIYCNTKIYLEVHHVTKRTLTWRKDVSVYGSRQRQNIEKRMAKTISLIILSFVVAWTPYAIVAFISSFFSPTLIPPLGGSLPAIFAKSSICFNPLVYILTNSHVRSNFCCCTRELVKLSGSCSSKDRVERSCSPRLQPSIRS